MPPTFRAIRAAMFQIPLPSEAVSLINFLVLDIFLLSYIMHMSGLLAGHANHYMLRSRRKLHLVAFDIPLVGGGIVMARNWRRLLFILLRLSVVAAVAVCNFGLEGRSARIFAERDVNIRAPGLLSDPFATIFSVTEPRIHCHNSTHDKDYKLGLVADGRCYRDVIDHVHVYVSSLGPSVEKIQASAKDCRKEVHGEEFPLTVYRCDAADLVCLGGSCWNHGIANNTCKVMVYSDNDKYAWGCQGDYNLRLQPGEENKELQCRRLGARRKDLDNWLEIYIHIVMHVKERSNIWSAWDDDNLLFRAVFASAYGVEKRVRVRLPVEEEQPVTVVRLWWLIPTLWVLGVAAIVTVWRLVHMFKRSPVIAHDERRLVRLLDRKIEYQLGDLPMSSFGLRRGKTPTIAF